MNSDSSTAWDISETEFPEGGSPQEQLKYVLRYAILAPSSHNSQPWRFRIRDAAVELLADYERSLPVADPFDRELIISCGAALFNLRTALNYFGRVAEARPFPDHRHPDLLARVTLDLAKIQRSEWSHLFRAIPDRITDRGAFTPAPVPENVQKVLREAAHVEGAWLHTISDAPTKERLASLIADADKMQFDNPDFRRELAGWLHSSRDKDGLPAYAKGAHELLGFAAPAVAFIVRTFDVGDGVAARDKELARGSPLLACLGTTRDTAIDWLNAGQALQRVLLAATHHGLRASFLNQPIEVATLRPALNVITGHNGFPQIVLRLGHGHASRHTPRRPLDDVLVDGTTAAQP